MEVWSHEVDGYRVTSYKDAPDDVIKQLKKDDLVKVHINRANSSSFDIPYEPDGEPVQQGEFTMQPMKPVSYTRWSDIQKALRAEEAAKAKADRIAERKAARHAAAVALKAAKDANKLGLDPDANRIIITETAATTVAQMEAGGTP